MPDAVRARAFLAFFHPPWGARAASIWGHASGRRGPGRGWAERPQRYSDAARPCAPEGSKGDDLTARPFDLARARACFGPRGTRGGSVQRRRGRAKRGCRAPGDRGRGSRREHPAEPSAELAAARAPFCETVVKCVVPVNKTDSPDFTGKQNRLPEKRGKPFRVLVSRDRRGGPFAALPPRARRHFLRR